MNITRNERARPGLTRKGCALEAAIHTGSFHRNVDGHTEFDELAFERFWSWYLAELLAQTEDDVDYLTEMLDQHSQQKPGGPGNQRSQKCRLVLGFMASFLVGLILTALLESYGLFLCGLALLLCGCGALLAFGFLRSITVA